MFCSERVLSDSFLSSNPSLNGVTLLGKILDLFWRMFSEILDS